MHCLHELCMHIRQKEKFDNFTPSVSISLQMLNILTTYEVTSSDLKYTMSGHVLFGTLDAGAVHEECCTWKTHRTEGLQVWSIQLLQNLLQF